MKKHEEALKYLQTARELNPQSLELWIGLGMTYLSLGQNDSALYYGQKVLRENPESEYGYFVTGYVYYLQGDGRRAKLALNRFLELAPERPESRMVRSMLEQIP
jgi:tetratricopeptide (TPR) repeat protein